MPAAIKINKSKLSIITMVFIYIPIVIFLFGFTRIYWALAASVCLAYGFYRYIRYMRQNRESGEDEYITISLRILLVCLLICLLTGLVSGWGAFFSQRDDWSKTNAILRDLIDYDWPVYYVNGGEHAALTYYIGGYLIPALAGKMLHSFSAAEITMLLYFTTGLFLLFLNAVAYINVADAKKILIFLCGMILFAGALIVAQGLTAFLYPDADWFFSGGDIRGEGLRLCYRSVMINLRWVPNQFIFPCLCGTVFLREKKDAGDYVFMLLPALLYGAFSFLGVVPIAVAGAVFYLAKKDIRLRDVFSLSNILISLSLGAILITYFLGNILSEKPAGMGLSLVTYNGGRFLGVYAVFCLFMFGLQAVLIWNRHRKDIMFITVIVLLLIIPFGRMGIENDWILGVSAIPMFFLMLFIWDFILNVKGMRINKGILIILLCIGAVYPAGHICQSVDETLRIYMAQESQNIRKDDYGTMKRYVNRTSFDDAALAYNYFTYDPEDDMFYRYIARKPFREEGDDV